MSCEHRSKHSGGEWESKQYDMKDKLTIVIPCKNEQKYIAHLLSDLQKQDALEGTRIIIADASTDDTRNVIKRNKGILNVEIIDGGTVSFAKNAGAKLATTEYILFLDADVRFFGNCTICSALKIMQEKDFHLLGAKIKCYDDDIGAKIGFMIFNAINQVLKYFSPFAVGLFMLTRRDKFEEYGMFPDRYAMSEDYILSRKYSIQKFGILDDYAGQDSRRLKKMGYLGMAYYLIQNFLNRNNPKHWENLDRSIYWND